MSQGQIESSDRDPGDEDDGARQEVDVVYELMLGAFDSLGDLVDEQSFDEAARALAAEFACEAGGAQ